MSLKLLEAESDVFQSPEIKVQATPGPFVVCSAENEPDQLEDLGYYAKWAGDGSLVKTPPALLPSDDPLLELLAEWLEEPNDVTVEETDDLIRELDAGRLNGRKLFSDASPCS